MKNWNTVKPDSKTKIIFVWQTRAIQFRDQRTDRKTTRVVIKDYQFSNYPNDGRRP